ncbi:TadE-like protein [Streptomyces zhaozhouensis]|uniref:TadE-like protein n=1 Tax=Streptomyces zhaozhouensis TaxID=1300267 RepID=A0A286DX08_9ACTN|nr:TadE family type IV pilus minor pilin [Streptomyces zhaozhouensis]SOD63192.1 TadE-like protein [Streptomyces zhaozhouensis]
MSWFSGRSTSRCDAGSVTVESALAIPTLMVLLGFLLGALGVFTTQALCQDAARGAARAAARGESREQVVRVAREVAPGDARVEISREGQLYRVTVSAPSRMTAAFGLAVSGGAVARVEPR